MTEYGYGAAASRSQFSVSDLKTGDTYSSRYGESVMTWDASAMAWLSPDGKTSCPISYPCDGCKDVSPPKADPALEALRAKLADNAAKVISPAFMTGDEVVWGHLDAEDEYVTYMVEAVKGDQVWVSRPGYGRSAGVRGHYVYPAAKFKLKPKDEMPEGWYQGIISGLPYYMDKYGKFWSMFTNGDAGPRGVRDNGADRNWRKSYKPMEAKD